MGLQPEKAAWKGRVASWSQLARAGSLGLEPGKAAWKGSCAVGRVREMARMGLRSGKSTKKGKMGRLLPLARGDGSGVEAWEKRTKEGKVHPGFAGVTVSL